MKLNKVLLGVVGSALVLGTVVVVAPKATDKVSASEPEVAVEVNQEEANEKIVVTETNIDENTETFKYRINYERTIQSGQNAIRGDRTLVYSINDGEEREEKMHKDMCEGDVYKWFCDVQVSKGDVVKYKVVTTYDDGTNSFPMEEGNGTVTVEESNVQE